MWGVDWHMCDFPKSGMLCKKPDFEICRLSIWNCRFIVPGKKWMAMLFDEIFASWTRFWKN
jgi:hypothetical protein